MPEMTSAEFLPIDDAERARLAQRATNADITLQGSNVLDFWRQWPPGKDWDPEMSLESLLTFTESDRVYDAYEFGEIQWVGEGLAPDESPGHGREFIPAHDWVLYWIENGRGSSSVEPGPKETRRSWASHEETLSPMNPWEVEPAAELWRSFPGIRVGVTRRTDEPPQAPKVHAIATIRDPFSLNNEEQAEIEAFRIRVQPPTPQLLVVVQWDDGMLTLVHPGNLVHL